MIGIEPFAYGSRGFMGFKASISRNYILQIVKSTLYVWATEDEIKVASETE